MKKIAFWFKYGPAEHTELFHAIPLIVEKLAAHAEVHYFGLASRTKPVPSGILEHAEVHHLPFRINRTKVSGKALAFLLWYLALPFVALRCRFMRIDLVYVDDYMPLGALITRIFYGKKVVFVVADFLHDGYADKFPLLKPLARLITSIDLRCWRRLPLIFTHAYATREFLAENGVPAARVRPVYDPCDTNLYHPAEPGDFRAQHGWTDDHIILVHHGILHPNKGNDRILRWLVPVIKAHPQLRYLVVGTGAEYENLQRLVRELGITDSVQFTGWLPTPQDVNRALNASDIGLVMRVGMRTDNFHVTGALVHSMAVGLPILAARLGGVSEIVKEDENGFLFEPSNGAEFRDRLIHLMGDANLRTRLGQAALKDSLRLFDPEKVSTEISDNLLRVLGTTA